MANIAHEKYKMFKNFMHNELGITKEDIRLWVTEAVQEEARKIVKESYDKFDINAFITKEIKGTKIWDNGLSSGIKELVAKELVKRMQIEVKEVD